MSFDTIVITLLSYLLGSVPFGLVLTKLAGMGDIRDIGSGNIGATNVLRTGRKDLAAATLLLDAGKGAIAVLLARTFADPALAPMAGAAAFLGHCFPIYLKFKGGKGVATFMGTLFAISPVIGLVAGGSWLLSALVLRISSLAALIAAAITPVYCYYVLEGDMWVFIGFMTVLIYVRHHENIGRILKGTEPKIGGSKKS